MADGEQGSQTPGERSAPRLGRRTLALGAVAAVALAGVVVVRVAGGDDGAVDERAGSVEVDESPGEPLDPVSEPRAYRIDYRVEIGPPGDRLISADRLEVLRPFGSRLAAHDGAVPDGDPRSVEIADFGRQRAQGSETAEPVVLAVPPGPGLTDTRIVAALADAVDDGRVERRERRRVLDRDCDVYRSLAPLAVSDLLPAIEGEHTDTCIDAAGLVLEEVSVQDGEQIARRIAVDVDVDADLDEERFAIGDPTVSTQRGGGFVAEVVPGSRAPGMFHEPAGPPPGFSLLGRFAVVPPQAEVFADPERRGERRTFVSDVFVDGHDVVVLDQGSTLGNVDPFAGFTGVPVEVGGFDDVELSYGRGGPVVLVTLESGRFLRVRGTVAPAVLIDLLDSLEPVEGSELELLDP